MDFICLDRRFWSKCYKHCHWPYFDESTICRLITEISTLVNKKFKMCPRWGLNSRPSDYETDALPTALLRPLFTLILLFSFYDAQWGKELLCGQLHQLIFICILFLSEVVICIFNLTGWNICNHSLIFRS